MLGLEPRNKSQPARTFGSIHATSVSVTMNKAESDRIHELCSLIAVERDRRKFVELVEELNRILEVNDQRLKKTQIGD